MSFLLRNKNRLREIIALYVCHQTSLEIACPIVRVSGIWWRYRGAAIIGGYSKGFAIKAWMQILDAAASRLVDYPGEMWESTHIECTESVGCAPLC